MNTLLIILHVLVCVALIIVVLLQAGKGAEVGASFGAGASQTIFGASGSRDFMSKLTTGAAIIFLLTSLTLAYFMDQPTVGSIMPETVAAPSATPTLPANPPAENPTK